MFFRGLEARAAPHMSHIVDTRLFAEKVNIADCSLSVHKIIHNAAVIKIYGYIIARDNTFQEAQYVAEHSEPVIDGKLNKATICRGVHSAHTIAISPLEYHSEPIANFLGFNKLNQILVLQIAVNRESSFQSGDSICRIAAVLLGRSTGELYKITLTVFFSTKADVSGILVIVNLKHRSILFHKAEIKSTFQLERNSVDVLQIIPFEIPCRHRITHIIVPRQNLLGLVQHGVHFVLSERNRPIYR